MVFAVPAADQRNAQDACYHQCNDRHNMRCPRVYLSILARLVQGPSHNGRDLARAQARRFPTRVAVDRGAATVEDGKS